MRNRLKSYVRGYERRREQQSVTYDEGHKVNKFLEDLNLGFGENCLFLLGSE